MGDRCSKCHASLCSTSSGAVCESCGSSYITCDMCGKLAPEYFAREKDGKTLCSSYCEERV